MNDKTITLYNAYKDGKEIYWNRTVVRECEYKYSSVRTTGQNGAIIYTPLLTVVIPVSADTAGKKYIDAFSYEKLTPEEVTGYFTFNVANKHDVIVAGECDKEITDSYKITDLQKEIEKSGTIISFDDNTDVKRLKHWKVVCK